jgi:hypothetical protein
MVGTFILTLEVHGRNPSVLERRDEVLSGNVYRIDDSYLNFHALET